MEDDSKPHARIDIKSSPAKFAAELTDSLQEYKVPIFKPGSRKRGDTWVISVFVLLQIGVFIVTMVVNNCWANSHGDCALKQIGRLSFQHLSENPLLGPSESTLVEMGALQRTLLTEYRQTWRLFTSPFLHAGVIHLVINLCSVTFVGIQLEQEFGALRIGIIYILSAFMGSLVASLYIQNVPAVGSSGALFGLLGTLLSALLWNWKFYTNKFAAIVSLIFVFVFNFALGLLPYVDNFSSIGGLISGFLLGFVLLFRPQQVAPNKEGLVEYDFKTYIKSKLKQKLDRPVVRIFTVILFSLLFAGCLVAVFHGININRYCKLCHYVDCIPFKRWHCKDIETSCETMVSNERLTLTCLGNGNFRIFPFTNITRARQNDLCSSICLGD
ncbi:hypothetical protein L6164_030537 [Bauhinia variegata]|uniref:Uncharacterized protein n=1 Tax=Bauhinia variegata TaxID=167791 RepID=A0ACB9LCI2_BAUVA|nr:hypothetical protein L6164_030537 [Bauhinia variegata]